MRSSHKYVGQEVQAGTIRRQVPPNQLFHSTAKLTLRRRYGRQFHCRPSLCRPGLSMPRVNRTLGTRSPPLASYLVQLCPTPADGSGRAAFNVESPIHQETIDAGPRASLNSRTTSGRIRQQR